MIKIDKRVVQNMLNSMNERTIVKCVIGLANILGLKVIAVGVETIEHGVMLTQLGCDLMQGYGIAQPMSADELAKWCNTWKPEPAWTNISSISA